MIRRVPLDRLLVETDSPFLAPVPHRGKRNEPAHVARVVATLAEMHGTDAAAVGSPDDRQLSQPVPAVIKSYLNRCGKIAGPLADL